MATTTPVSETTADLPGFSAPRAMPDNDPLDPTVTTAPGGPGTGEAASPGPFPWSPEAEGDGAAGEAPPGPSPTTTSRGPGRSRGFTDPGVFVPVVEALLGIAGLVVKTIRKAPGALWLPDEQDQAAIAPPLARIAARHSPVSGGEANDVADGLAAAVGAAGYVAKNVMAEQQYNAGAAPPETAETGWLPQ